MRSQLRPTDGAVLVERREREIAPLEPGTPALVEAEAALVLLTRREGALRGVEARAFREAHTRRDVHERALGVTIASSASGARAR